MAIPVQCPACGKTLNVKDEMAGKRGKCPQCGNIIEVPRPGAIPQAPAPPAPEAPQPSPPPPSPPAAPAAAAYAAPTAATGYKPQSTAFLLSMFLGGFGVDRFYLGYTGLGIAKLLTGGGCGIWSIVDFVLTGMGKMKDAQGRPLQEPPPVGTPTKSRTVTFILAWLLGGLGIDRFYLGYTGLGIVKLLTFGGCGIWSLVDVILVGTGGMKDAQGNSLLRD